MSSKLLPRIYYTLTQAARELDCAEDYLLHLGATARLFIHQFGTLEGRLKPILFRDVNDSRPLSKDEKIEVLDYLEEVGALYVGSEAFIQLHPWTVRDYEVWGSASFSSFRDITSIHPPADFLLMRHGDDIISLLSENNFQLEIYSFQFISYLENESDCTDAEAQTLTIEVNPKALFILAPEVERLRRGESPEPVREMPPEIAAEIHPEPGKKRVNAYLRTISALSQALLGKKLTQPHKDAYAILQALGAAGIEEPVKEDALAGYLKAAGEVEKKHRG